MCFSIIIIDFKRTPLIYRMEPGDETNPGKLSRTEIDIIEYGTFQVLLIKYLYVCMYVCMYVYCMGKIPCQ